MNNDTQDVREALVIKSTGSWYTLCDSLSGERVEARLSGRIRLQGRRSTNPIVVGDRVDYHLETAGTQPLPEPGNHRGKTARKRTKGRAADVPQAASRAVQEAESKAVSPTSESIAAPITAPVTEPATAFATLAANHIAAAVTAAIPDPAADRPADSPPGMTGVITRIHERHNYIIRRSSNLSRESHIIAANIDQAFLVATLAFPETSFEFIDRFLVTAEAYHIPAVVVLNKADLYDTPELRERRELFLETYALAGYEVMEVAAALDRGVGPLRKRLQGRVSLLSGNSGVGKSTLIRAVDPSLQPRVGAISDYHRRGRHTTTFSEMYPLSGGGWLIDTPGIKGFGLIDLSGDEVGRYFPDLFRYAPRCGYYNCTHTHEPGCAVKAAVEQGEVSPSRYISYLKLLEEDEKYRK